MKKITFLFLVVLGTISASYGQFSESFDTGVTAPAGWTVINGGGTSTFIFGVGAPGSAFSAPNAAQINFDAVAHDDYLVTPQIAVTAGLNDRLTYYVKNQDPAYVEAYEVKLSTTTATAAAFTAVLTPVADAPSTWTQFTIDLTPYVGQSIYIGFHAVSTDKFRLLFDNVVNDTPPSVAPNCVTLTAPLNAATGVSPSPSVTLSWTAATTGPAASSYDVYLDTNPSPTTLLGNQVALTRTVTGLLSTTTYYWKVVAKNTAGEATGCSIFSFTTSVDPFAPYCGPLVFATSVEPITLVNFAGINNATSPTVAGATAHEVFTSITGNVTAGSPYTITLQGNTAGAYTNRFIVFADWNQDGDFTDSDESYPIIQTIIGSTGVDAQVATQSLLVPPTATVGTTRMRVKKIFGTTDYTNPCLGAGYGQVEDYTLSVAALPSDLPDYVSLQSPTTATIAQGGSIVVYGQVYEAGLTEPVGQATGINAWVGISPVGSNTNPNTWTNWVAATYNSTPLFPNNNDEYQATIGSTLTPGTYYYATRFQLNGGAFVYGGTDNALPNANGNFWNGTTYVSGVLTVNAPLPVAPNCDLTATLADPTLGGSTWSRPFADGSGLSASGIDVSYHIYGPFNVDVAGSYTFTSEQDYDGFVFVYQNSFDPNSPLVNYLAGNDDSGLGSVITTDLATATNYYFVTTSFAPEDFGTFTTTITGVGTATCGTLAVPGFNDANFSFYPNPVKNTLNLSYNQEISNVDVFNLLGQKVIATKLNSNSGQIDMSSIPNGAYMVKVTSNNQVKTIKVIKQ